MRNGILIFLASFLFSCGNGRDHSSSASDSVFSVTDSITGKYDFFVSVVKGINDSNATRLLSMKDDSAKVREIDAVAYDLTSNGENDKARELTYCNLDLARRIKNRYGVGYAYSELGMIAEHTGNYAVAARFHELALKNDISIGDSSRIAADYTNLGIIYDDQSIYPIALQHYFSGLRIAEVTGDTQIIAGNYNNIGAVYENMGEYDHALEYLEKALALKKITGKELGAAITYNSIGDVFKSKGDLRSALSNYYTALAITKKLHHQRGTAAVSDGIAECYIALHTYDSAMIFLDSSLAICEATDDADGKASVFANKGRAYAGLMKNKEAEDYFNKSLSLAIEIGDKEVMKACYAGLRDLAELKNDFGNALIMQKLFVATRDSISNEESTRKNVREQLQYEFGKKHDADSIRALEVKKQDELKHDQQVSRQKAYTYGGISGFVLMLIVALVSFRAFRNKAKANGVIARQKEIVEIKQKEVLDSIHYAKRIQKSLLPSETYIIRHLEKLRKDNT